MELTDFMHASTILHKLKDDWKFFGWSCSKIGMASLVMGLKNEKME